MKFRVRKTDDYQNSWTVADGDTFPRTKHYINSKADITTCCSIFPTEIQAEQALALYEAKHKSVEEETKYGHPRFYELLEAMAELHSRKNHDYAGTSDPLKNLWACNRLNLEPFMGVMVRLQDKWSRLEEFVKSGKLMVKGESVKDTLMDNAVYSILAIILYEEQEKNEAN